MLQKFTVLKRHCGSLSGLVLLCAEPLGLRPFLDVEPWASLVSHIAMTRHDEVRPNLDDVSEYSFETVHLVILEVVFVALQVCARAANQADANGLVVEPDGVGSGHHELPTDFNLAIASDHIVVAAAQPPLLPVPLVNLSDSDVVGAGCKRAVDDYEFGVFTTDHRAALGVK